MRSLVPLLLLFTLPTSPTTATTNISPFNYGTSSSSSPATLHALDTFNADKFGMFLHNGPVTQWGVEIAWPLICQSFPCLSQGPNATKLNITNEQELQEHRQAYLNLGATYNPHNFNATHIARTAKAAGFKYVVYTTIHCDGFANWPSNITQFNIRNTALSPPRDIYGELVTALRVEGLKVGAYMCPTLWNDPNYVYPDPLSTLNINGGEEPTYDPLQQPTLWSNYVRTLHGMAQELAALYAPDLFWFDCHDTPNGMDTRLEEIIAVVRDANPSALIMTRNGVFSDYTDLADQSEAVVNQILNQPAIRSGTQFEVGTPIQASKQWAFDPTSLQKPVSEVISNLMLIVAKGGNYLVNFSPGPDGQWAPSAESTLLDMKEWMDVNGEGIHGTTPMFPYQFNDVREGTSGVAYFTSKVVGSGKGVAVYVLIPTSVPTAASVLVDAAAAGVKKTTGAATGAATGDVATVMAANHLHAASMITLPSFRPALLSPRMKRTSVELLGVPGQVKATQNWNGLVLDASALERPSHVSNGIVYKIMFEEIEGKEL